MNQDRLLVYAKIRKWNEPLLLPTHVASHRNPMCGDQVKLFIKISESSIITARFQGQGCLVSQSCAGMLCEEIEGRSVQDLLQIPAQQLMEFDFEELSPVRQQCALLAHRVLLQLLVHAE